ncbi:MAG TPA: PmoA family protein [Sedimentisphaerales bacterium]|nr:PmoA family protein [Sedimentisphaerales bacterium]
MSSRTVFVVTLVLLALTSVGCIAAQSSSQSVEAKVEDNKVVVTIDGKLFTCYKFDHSQKYPYFWPVNGPTSGQSITTETSEPYPHHHSLFFGCDRVNGGNYWQESNERGQILSQGPKIVESSGGKVVIEDECLWKQPDKDPIIRDRRRIVITAPSETHRFIDFAITLEPLTDIRILKTNHSLFAARVVPELSVLSGGTLINAEGKTGEKGTFDVASPWCDYSGSRNNVTEGIAILQHPTNQWYPSKWFTRDYGFFSPTPMNWLEGDKLDLPKGQKLTLNYRVVVHAGDSKQADIPALFDAYKQTKPLESASVSPVLENIRVSDDSRGFVTETGSCFTPWGFNYDHDETGRLLEDYWGREWLKVEADFEEMKQLGANVVRVHLQLGRFMQSPTEPNEAALETLGRLVGLAERLHLYLDLTGLACYHKADVPSWYDSLSEQDRWEVQARFWEAVAERCAASPSVFCYDLMNEPVAPGDKKESEWLLGELAGKYFVQRISLDLAGRTQQQVAKSWVDRLVKAIRSRDDRHLITVGVIPWVQFFPQAKPLFYSRDVAENLDFASIHFYPETDKVDPAITALAAYNIGKPVVIEETFPLKCSPAELGEFIDKSRATACGWISFYWGKTPSEYRESNSISDALTLAWLELFEKRGPFSLEGGR